MTAFTEMGFLMLLRWLHFFFGVIWIGHLYYFNFTQMTIMGKADNPTKSGITRVLLPEALWWFRWGAMWTMVTGLAYYMVRGHELGSQFFASGYGTSITVGALFGLTMWANVWFVIWPKQKIVMANAEQVANGGAALPNAAAAASGARLASRTNTLFSIPMLFYMGASSHFSPQMSDSSNLTVFWVLFAGILLGLEINALKGKPGPIDTSKGVIASGFVLTAIVFTLMSVLVG